MGIRILIIIGLLFVAGPSFAQEQQQPKKDDPRYRNVAAMGTPVGREQTTTLILDQQDRESQSGQTSLSKGDQLQANKDRAVEMVEMLKTEELQKALDKVTKRGKQILQDDPSLKTPVGIIAGAAGLWFGKSLKLISGELNVSTHIEARARKSEFSMQHPLLNGRFTFSADGVDIHMDRKISSINSEAEVNYNLRNQVFSTSIRKRITPNLDFSFGAKQIPQTTNTDGSARLEYHWDF